MSEFKKKTGALTPLKLFLVGTLTVVLAATTPPRAMADKAAEQVEALLAKMTLEEKLGQMTQVDMNAVKDKADIAKFAFGSMLSGGDSDPASITPEGWSNSCKEFQSWALKSRLKIPLVYGIDAVHGHNNVDGAVVFPQNIGLGATRNASLVQKAGRVTAEEIAGTAMHWAFAPCVAAAQNIRWGRTYESFSEDPVLAGKLGAAATKGLQMKLPGGLRILACPKHFAGDGGTVDGIDQGNVVGDESAFRKLHIQQYVPAIKAGAGSIMVSYNSWNGEKLHGHKHLLMDVLKKELGFEGFLVSDWAAIDQINPDYKLAVEKAINAGVDMAMIPNGPGQKNNYVDYINILKELVAEGRVAQSRIDDAVHRILRVKFEMGLMENPYGVPALLKSVGSEAHRKVARECVRESLVVLKNENQVLPLTKKTRKLAVWGKAANDLGIQCGGWTVTWQGKTGKVMSGGTTLLAGLRKVAGTGTAIEYFAEGSPSGSADAILVVIGESPYAEMKGDRSDLSLSAEDAALLKKAHSTGRPVVAVLYSGRPMVLADSLKDCDAFVAAWLPGTEGDGVAEVLCGKAKPKGKLSRTWPKDNSQLNYTMNSTEQKQPLFPIGYGLTW